MGWWNGHDVYYQRYECALATCDKYFPKVQLGIVKNNFRTPTQLKILKTYLNNKAQGVSTSDNFSSIFRDLNFKHDKPLIKRLPFYKEYDEYIFSKELIQKDFIDEDTREVLEEVLEFGEDQSSELFTKFFESLQIQFYDEDTKDYIINGKDYIYNEQTELWSNVEVKVETYISETEVLDEIVTLEYTNITQTIKTEVVKSTQTNIDPDTNQETTKDIWEVTKTTTTISTYSQSSLPICRNIVEYENLTFKNILDEEYQKLIENENLDENIDLWNKRIDGSDTFKNLDENPLWVKVDELLRDKYEAIVIGANQLFSQIYKPSFDTLKTNGSYSSGENSDQSVAGPNIYLSLSKFGDEFRSEPVLIEQDNEKYTIHQSIVYNISMTGRIARRAIVGDNPDTNPYWVYYPINLSNALIYEYEVQDIIVADWYKEYASLFKSMESFLLVKTKTKNDEIKYYFIKDSEKYKIKQGKIKLSTPLPLKWLWNPPNTISSKRFNLILRQNSYEYPNYRSSVARNKFGNSLKTSINNNENIGETSIAQYLDLKPFFYKEARNDKYWQNYLKTIFKYLEEWCKPTNDLYTTQKVIKKFNVGSMCPSFAQTYYIRMLKKQSNGDFTKKCFIGMEPNDDSMWLYLNTPNIENEVQVGFTQYALDLSFWFNGTHYIEPNPKIKRLKKTLVNSRVKGTKTYYDPDYFCIATDPLLPVISYIDTIKHSIYYSESNTTDIGYYDEYITINVNATLDGDFSKDWINDGETYPKYSYTKIYRDSFTGQVLKKEFVEINDDEVEMLLKSFVDDRLDGIPNFKEDYDKDASTNSTNSNIDIYMGIKLMPQKLWFKTPYTSQQKVVDQTIFIYYRVFWKVREGGASQIVSFIIAVVAIGMSGGSALPAVMAAVGLIMSMYAQMLPKELKLAMAIVSLITAAYGGWQTFMSDSPGLLAQTNAVLITLNAVVNVAVQIDQYNLQDNIENLANDTQQDRDALAALQENKKEYFFGINHFQVDTEFDKSIDNYFYKCYGENVYDIYEWIFDSFFFYNSPKNIYESFNT